MKSLQKLGGFAALYEAAAYLTGMVFFLVIVNYQGMVDPLQRVALLVENQIGMVVTNLIIYVVFGIALVVLSLALHDRLRGDSPALMQVATAFGLIWATVVIASGMVFNIGMERVVGLSQSALSQHLARLRRDGVVKTRRDGKTICYSLNGKETAIVLETLYRLFSEDVKPSAASVRIAGKPNAGRAPSPR